MIILAITDIPRLVNLFERLAQQHHGLVVVSEIHRGIERLKSIQPDVVIIQNHLAGLSADILHKHLKSRLGHRKVRFVLISTSDLLDVELSSRFEIIIDPALVDEQIEQQMQRLFKDQGAFSSNNEAFQQKPPVKIESPKQVLLATPPQADLSVISQPQHMSEKISAAAGSEESCHASGLYEFPRRTGFKIDSDFSKKLDISGVDLQPEPTPNEYQKQDISVRDFQRLPHLIEDVDNPLPWYRRSWVVLVLVTLLVVVGVSLFQNFVFRESDKKKVVPDSGDSKTGSVVVPPPSSQAAISTARQMSPPVAQIKNRLRKLPGFIPKEGLDQAYSKDNPGWECYRGLTNEYRIFREKDELIKAIQIIDRSGAGIQEVFFSSVLQELAGVTIMPGLLSEVKEGYEIRRGTVGGLQLVQYRDAQEGGRMRGFVITWP